MASYLIINVFVNNHYFANGASLLDSSQKKGDDIFSTFTE